MILAKSSYVQHVAKTSLSLAIPVVSPLQLAIWSTMDIVSLTGDLHSRLDSLFMKIVYKGMQSKGLCSVACSSLCGSFLLAAAFILLSLMSVSYAIQYIFIYNNKSKDNSIKISYADFS